MKNYLIVSARWTLSEKYIREGLVVFWRPDSKGYTNDITEAGRYTAEEVAHLIGDSDASPIHVDDLETLFNKPVTVYRFRSEGQIENLHKQPVSGINALLLT